MRKITILIACITAALASPCFALLCPGNFTTINMGDSLEQVKSACGTPDSETTKNATTNLPQEWVYYIRVDPTQTATLKTTIAFADNKVVNMSSNGIGMTNTSICGAQVQLGYSTDQVKAACGKPAMINEGDASQGSATPPIKITELVYMSAASTTTLVFKNGQLVERK